MNHSTLDSRNQMKEDLLDVLLLTRVTLMMSGTTRTAKAVSQANLPTRVRDASVVMDVCAEPTVRRIPGGLGRAVQDELFPAR